MSLHRNLPIWSLELVVCRLHGQLIALLEQVSWFYKLLIAKITLELARGALHLWKLRKFILNAWRYEQLEDKNEMEEIEELESLVQAARMPGDYASKVIKKGLLRMLMGEELESF